MKPRLQVVVSGVSAVGKSTVGRSLAERLDASFIDADDLHPIANVARMRAGIPLSDEDRWPWLDLVGGGLAAGPRVVMACSALKRTHRDRIRAAAPDAVFVQLVADRDALLARAAARAHFMPASLLDSQLDALEALGPGEAGVTLDVSRLGAAEAAVAAHGRIEALRRSGAP